MLYLNVEAHTRFLPYFLQGILRIHIALLHFYNTTSGLFQFYDMWNVRSSLLMPIHLSFSSLLLKIIFECLCLSCVHQLCSSVSWGNWCVKVLLVVFHFRGGVTALPTVCLFTRMSPAAMVTRFYLPSRLELCAIKACSIL